MKKHRTRPTSIILVLILVILMPCPLLGQGIKKKQLTEADYDLWATLRATSISDDGLWVSYRMSYPTGADTLFVKNTQSPAMYRLPKIQNGFFLRNSRYAFLSNGNLEIIRLDTGARKYIGVVKDCQPVKEGEYLLVTKAVSDITSLFIYNCDGSIIRKMDHIKDYKLNHAKNALLYSKAESQGYRMGIAYLGVNLGDRVIIDKNATEFSKMTWSADDKAVAFQGIPYDRDINPGTLYFYNTDIKKLDSINDDTQGFPKGQRLSADDALHLRISNDHKHVFFGSETSALAQHVKAENDVEIWKHNDTILYPTQQEVNRSPKHESHLAAWNVDVKNVVIIGKGQYRWALMAGNNRYVISSGNATDFRDLLYYQNTEYYITDVVTGITSLLLASHPGTSATFSISPDGRYLAYLNQGNWWTYDTHTEKHRNITHTLSTHWDTSVSKPGYSVFSFGVAGWDHSSNLVIYDEYDIWNVSPNGAGGKRLTTGKEGHIRYRLAANEGSSATVLSYSATSSRIIDFKQDIILSSYNTKNGVMGYAELHKGNVAQISSEKYNAERLFVSRNPSRIIYEEQGYDLPPRIVSYSRTHKASKVIAESNTHHNSYEWGHSEIISYQVGRDSLKGVLIYPAGYKSGEKYPMVTFIYELLLHRAQEYVNPSRYNVMGFNSANFSAKGYFILLPDIRYRPGYPGESALECITAAVNITLQTGMVDPSGIGIIGHSFGGYETNYIIAHSKLFSAAVSGAGVSEIIHSYLSYGAGTTEMDYWRFEDQQFRIGKSFFEAPELYIANSPIFNAADITTPLLTWAGKNDPVVRPDQSFMMYAAMRRLKKKNILLLYPEDVHALANKKNQEDITMRVESWFDHYLKGFKADWLE